MKKTLIAAALLGSTLISSAAMAQAAPQPAAAATANVVVGAKVYGPQGAEVGNVENVSGGNVVVFTGTNRATLPIAAFGTGPNGLVIGLTKAQLDAAVAQAEAKSDAALAAALVAGAQVASRDGVAIGTVQKIEGNNVIIDRPAGAITLQREHLAADANGLKLFMTAAEFEAAANAAANGAGSAAAQ